VTGRLKVSIGKDDMITASALRRAKPGRPHMRVASLCFLVLFLEGYDITSMSYAIPSLIEAWHAKPPDFTAALTAGSFGLLFGALGAGLLGDRLGRKPVLIGCTVIFGLFSLLTAFSTGLISLAVLRFSTGLGLGGGIPIASGSLVVAEPIQSISAVALMFRFRNVLT
jgi:MFS transporter, AAHS family, 4-hydroxybenzoate transporter